MNLINDQNVQRLRNHPHSELSKCPTGITLPNPAISVGDIVYLYVDRQKHRGRRRYLVVSVDSPWCNVRKFAGTQLRNTSYHVKLSDCFRVPDQSPPTHHYTQDDDYATSDEDVPDTQRQSTPEVPDVPIEISMPADQLLKLASVPDAHAPTRSDSQCCALDQTTALDDQCIDNDTHVPPVDSSSPRKSTRAKRQPVKFNDYYLDS